MSPLRPKRQALGGGLLGAVLSRLIERGERVRVYDAIAPGRFGGVERAIGRRIKPIEAFLGAALSDAGGNRDADSVAHRQNRRRRDTVAESRQLALDIPRRARGEQREFLAADPRDKTQFAKLRSHSLRD